MIMDIEKLKSICEESSQPIGNMDEFPLAKALHKSAIFRSNVGPNHVLELIKEIQTLRAKVEVLVDALRFYADKSSYDCDHDIGMEVSHRVILYKDQYEHNQSTYYAGRRAIEALATYDKLSEVKK